MINNDNTTEQNPKILACFDFDETIVNSHFHSEMGKAGLKPAGNFNSVLVAGQDQPKSDQYDAAAVQKEAEKLLQDPQKGIKNKEELLTTFKTLLKDGNEIAITSFTQYPDVIKPTLKEMGLTEEEVSKIHIVGGFPSHGQADSSPDGKKEHIDKAMELAGIKPGDYGRVMLVDDSVNNINKARNIGVTAVQVPKGVNPNPSYLNDAVDQANGLTKALQAGKVYNASVDVNAKNEEVMREQGVGVGSTIRIKSDRPITMRARIDGDNYNLNAHEGSNLRDVDLETYIIRDRKHNAQNLLDKAGYQTNYNKGLDNITVMPKNGEVVIKITEDNKHLYKDLVGMATSGGANVEVTNNDGKTFVLHPEQINNETAQNYEREVLFQNVEMPSIVQSVKGEGHELSSDIERQERASRDATSQFSWQVSESRDTTERVFFTKISDNDFNEHDRQSNLEVSQASKSTLWQRMKNYAVEKLENMIDKIKDEDGVHKSANRESHRSMRQAGSNTVQEMMASQLRESSASVNDVETVGTKSVDAKVPEKNVARSNNVDIGTAIEDKSVKNAEISQDRPKSSIQQMLVALEKSPELSESVDKLRRSVSQPDYEKAKAESVSKSADIEAKKDARAVV